MIPSGVNGLWGIALCLVVLFFIRFKKPQSLDKWMDMLLVAVSGIFGLISLAVVGAFPRTKV